MIYCRTISWEVVSSLYDGRSRHILYQPYINNILKLYMKFQNLSTYRHWEMNKILKDSLEKRKNIGWLFWLLWPHLKLTWHEVASSNSQGKPVVSLTWRSRWPRFGHLQLLNINPVQNSGWLQDQVCGGQHPRSSAKDRRTELRFRGPPRRQFVVWVRPACLLLPQQWLNNLRRIKQNSEEL